MRAPVDHQGGISDGHMQLKNQTIMVDNTLAAQVRARWDSPFSNRSCMLALFLQCYQFRPLTCALDYLDRCCQAKVNCSPRDAFRIGRAGISSWETATQPVQLSVSFCRSVDQRGGVPARSDCGHSRERKQISV